MPHRNKNQNTPVVGAQSLVVIGIVDHGPEVSHLSLCRTVCCSLHAFGIMFELLSFSSRLFTPTPEALLLLPEFFLFVFFFLSAVSAEECVASQKCDSYCPKSKYGHVPLCILKDLTLFFG